MFPLDEAIPLSEKAGWMISMRSGLCDLISSANCVLTVLYYRTNFPKGIRYSNCSLKKMGLRKNVLEYEYGLEENLEKLVERIVMKQS